MMLTQGLPDIGSGYNYGRRGRLHMPKSDRNSGKAWTSSEIDQLRSLANENTPTRVISLKLGRTPSAIYSKASDEGISLDPPNQRPYGTKK